MPAVAAPPAPIDVVIITCVNHNVNNHTPTQPFTDYGSMKRWIQLRATACATCNSTAHVLTLHLVGGP